MISNNFYMVASQGSKSTVAFRTENKEEAEKKAIEMSTKNQKRYYVLESIISVNVTVTAEIERVGETYNDKIKRNQKER